MTTSESERMANVGIPVDLKQFPSEQIRVKELSLETLLGIGRDMIELVSNLPLDELTKKEKDSQRGIKIMGSILQNPKTLESLKTFAASSIGKQKRELDGMGLSDWMKWAVACKEAMEWQELTNLFTQLIPANMRSQLLKRANQT